MKSPEIEELNEHVSDALDMWKAVMFEADVNRLALDLDYTDDDLWNALYILNHVASNIGVKNGTANLQTVEGLGNHLRSAVCALSGRDPSDLSAGRELPPPPFSSTLVS